MKILLLALSFCVMQISAQTYCVPEFDEGCDYGDLIDSFQIPTAQFSHLNSGCSTNSYGDFTSMTISLAKGIPYDYNVTHDYSGEYVKIWVDFNNDGIFEDVAPELISSAESGPESFTNGSILIPSSVSLGTYRMRISNKYNSNPIPCNEFGYGEAHDYTLAVTATPSCIFPTGVAASNITTSGATISWTPPSSTVNGYEYYVSQNNILPSASTVPTGSVTAGNISVPLNGLSTAAVYYVWVRSVCSATDKSSWSSPVRFSTGCGTVTPSYSNDFSNEPICWTYASGGSPTSAPTDVNQYWYNGNFLNSGTGSMRINLYSSDNAGWMKTLPFDLSAGGYQVKFDYGMTEYDETTPSPMGSDDVIHFLVSNDGGVTWTILQTWNAANSPSNVSTQYLFNLNTYNSANTIFAFYGSDGTVNDIEDYEFFVDNFTVEPNVVMSTIENTVINDRVKAYPNPFTDVLNISDIKNVSSIAMMDVSGKLVKTFAKPESVLHLSDLKSGMYVVVLTMKDSSKQTIKAIKK